MFGEIGAIEKGEFGMEWIPEERTDSEAFVETESEVSSERASEALLESWPETAADYSEMNY